VISQYTGVDLVGNLPGSNVADLVNTIKYRLRIAGSPPILIPENKI
jgi:hypothetical protein